MVRTVAKTRTKQMACRECGEPITVGSNTRNQPRCLRCGIQAGTDSIVQISRCAGPYFERWLQGCMARARIGGGGDGGSGE